MAKMIPHLPYEGCRSDGERELFIKLADDPLTRDWVVLHSLWIADHPKQQSGEADFVIIIPRKGVLFLEVKACRTFRLEAGTWHYGSLPRADSRGPFRQAADAMFAVRDPYLKLHPDSSGILFCSGVLFTHCRFQVSSPEWNSWQVLDSSDFHRRSIAQRIESIVDHARTAAVDRRFRWFDPTKPIPTIVQCEEFAAHLRPKYEPLETPADRTRVLDRELRRCTDEQLRILDSCSTASRIVVSGPAGTGKTYLAIAAVDREVAVPGKRVLLVCFNRLLGQWLKQEVAPLGERVRVMTLHRLMMDIIGLRDPPTEAPQDFWQSELPERALRVLIDHPDPSWGFDALVLDEAQDIFAPSYVDVFDLLLKNGLSAGRWRMFGDFDRQSIFESDPGDVSRALARLRSVATPLQLRDNCRNTPIIARLASHLGGLSPPYARVLRPDDGLSYELRFYASEAQQRELLITSLNALQEKGFADREITILSPRRDSESVASHLTGAWKTRLVPNRSERERGVRYSTIHRFKGMESRAVIITDVNDVDGQHAQDLFYVGITRAQSRLTILCNEDVREPLQRRIVASLTARGA